MNILKVFRLFNWSCGEFSFNKKSKRTKIYWRNSINNSIECISSFMFYVIMKWKKNNLWRNLANFSCRKFFKTRVGIVYSCYTRRRMSAKIWFVKISWGILSVFWNEPSFYMHGSYSYWEILIWKRLFFFVFRFVMLVEHVKHFFQSLLRLFHHLLSSFHIFFYNFEQCYLRVFVFPDTFSLSSLKLHSLI